MNGVMHGREIGGGGDIFFLTESPGQAAAAIHDLRSAALGPDGISVVVHNMESTEDPHVGPAALNAALASIAGATAGAALGWVVLGSLLATGPLVAAIGAGAIGGSASGLLAALVSAGMPDHHAHACHERVKDGHILIVAHSQTAEQREQVQAILAARGLAAVDARAAQRW